MHPQLNRLDRMYAPEWEDTRDVAILLPVGSTEQHGPHLPLGTDTAIATAICAAACRRSQALVLAPPVPFGVSHHHASVPGGATSVDPSALAAYLTSVLQDLVDPARNRSVVVVNGHGGNWSVITFVLDTLGAQCGELPITACCWWHLVPDLVDDSDPYVLNGRIGHAGAVETSVFLAIDTEAVRSAHAPERDHPPTLSVSESVGYRWTDFGRFEDGVVGAPRRADPAFGERIVSEAADRLVKLALELGGLSPARHDSS
jgi:creatinine amidohydrolase/Fe(II)-dependent formamide hydrolase-like protein